MIGIPPIPPGAGGPNNFAGRGVGDPNSRIRAKRAWGLDKDGYLRGYYYHYRWEPDVLNVASCENPSYKDKPHQVGDIECGHGFYGYYDGSNDYHDKHGLPISGMIECGGITLVGSRGVRAEKARIVALTVPDYPVLPDTEFDRMIASAFEADITFMSHLDRNNLGHFSFGDSQQKMTVVRRSSFDAFMNRYGSVPIFHDADRMVSEYPCEEGEVIEFDVPDVPFFD